MKKLNLVFLSLLTVFNISCEEKKMDCCVDISVDTRILYQNSKSENLLTLPNGIKAGDVKLYYVANGKAEYYYQAMFDSPTGVSQMTDQNGNQVLKVMMNSVKEDFPVTYIKLSETDTDTIKTEYVREQASTIAVKVWYNGVLKWDVKSKTGNTFTVVK